MIDESSASFVNFAITSADASGGLTAYAVPAGKKFIVTYLFVQTEADLDITIKSASTALSGALTFSTATTRERTFYNSGWPVFKTIATGEDFVITSSGAGQVNGFGIGLEIHQ